MKRKRFWIDPSAQLRVLAFVTGLLGVSLALSYVSMDRGLEQVSEQTRRLYIPVDWARESLRVPFLFSSAVILLGGGMLTLLWSHRVVGPILVLTAGLRRIRDGNLKGDVKIRDTDSLKDTVEDFTAMQGMLRRHVAEDRERLASLDQRLAALAERLERGSSTRGEIEAIREDLAKVSAYFQL
ncbi:MAG: methyl-accepting chemotaxis protein [Elusimicrobia bacterium]|nr:methyl-accepting chemotaxis protein [Elusimicrobiota bacterium]